jgi:hypothetical protein
MRGPALIVSCGILRYDPDGTCSLSSASGVKSVSKGTFRPLGIAPTTVQLVTREPGGGYERLQAHDQSLLKSRWRFILDGRCRDPKVARSPKQTRSRMTAMRSLNHESLAGHKSASRKFVLAQYSLGFGRE